MCIAYDLATTLMNICPREILAHVPGMLCTQLEAELLLKVK